MELGVRFVKANNETQAELPKIESNIDTCEHEILWSNLMEILSKHTKDNVGYRFGNLVTAIQEEKEGMVVTFQNGENRRFDLLVCAVGIRSRTRILVFCDELVTRF